MTHPMHKDWKERMADSEVTEEKLIEADLYLAGPAHDPQFANRRTELYEQRKQKEAERLDLLHRQELM